MMFPKDYSNTGGEFLCKTCMWCSKVLSITVFIAGLTVIFTLMLECAEIIRREKMDVNELIKGLKTHIDMKADCDDCPFKDKVLCVDKLIEATIRALEEKDNG